MGKGILAWNVAIKNKKKTCTHKKPKTNKKFNKFKIV